MPISPCRLFDYRPAPDQVGPVRHGPATGRNLHASGARCQRQLQHPSGRHSHLDERHGRRRHRGQLPHHLASRCRPEAVGVEPQLGARLAAHAQQGRRQVARWPTASINLFNLAGTVYVLADVVGYYADHNFDDRYYTKAEVDTKQARIASSTNNGTPLLNDGATITTVALTVVGSTNWCTSRVRPRSSRTAPKPVHAVLVGFCNIGIEIFDADTNTRLTPINGAFYRLTTASDGGTLYVLPWCPLRSERTHIVCRRSSTRSTSTRYSSDMGH